MGEIQCWYCHKPITYGISPNMLFRGIAICPECLESSRENQDHPLLKETAALIERKRCLKAVAEEEEFGGAMPDELFLIIKKACDDRMELDRIFRAVVQFTKHKIKERIEVDK